MLPISCINRALPSSCFGLTDETLTLRRLAVGLFEGLVGASIGFGVTTTYSHGESRNCNVGPNSVVQVWGRHKMAWAEVKENQCSTCSGCHGPSKQGYVLMPQNDIHGQIYGCSEGSIFVAC